MQTVGKMPLEYSMQLCTNTAKLNHLESILLLFPIACFTAPKNSRVQWAGNKTKRPHAN